MNTKSELTSIIKASITLFVIIISFACSNDDDSPSQPTTMELLTAEKWYSESSTYIMMTECRKHTWIQFLDNGTLIVESYYTNSNDDCVSNPLVTAAWNLVNDTQYTTTYYNETLLYNIISISEDELRISTEEDGETTAFQIYDKNPGNG